MTPDIVILDFATALETMGGDEEIYREVLATYLESTPSLFSDISAALNTGDMKTVRRHAHSLKSSSRSIGGMRIGARGEDLEKTAGSISSREIEITLNTIRNDFEELRRELAVKGLIPSL